MTKKHFIALADAIKEHHARNSHPLAHFNKPQLECLMAFCRAQNPQFNASRWLNYIDGNCGPSGGAVKQTSNKGLAPQP